MKVPEISTTLLQHISNIVLYTDVDGHIEYVNPEFEKTTLFNKSEVVGSTPRILKPDKQQGKDYVQLWKDIKAGKVWQTTFINQKKNGDLYYQETKIIPVKKANKITGFLSVGTDITDSVRKVIFVDNLTNELYRLNKDFGTLIYKTSHDLRSPVANILGILELAKLDIDHPKMEQYFNMISQSAGKLDRILADLMQLSMIRASALATHSVNFNFLLDEIIRSLDKFYPVGMFTIARSIQATRVYKFDKIVLRNLLRPVLENAFQYRKYEPEQTLPAEASRHQVGITIFETDNYLVIRIQDNGVGIEKRNQHKIFDMFYKASPQSYGPGLGLFIVKSALQRMQGEIEVESKEGVGTTFTIYLPYNEKTKAKKQNATKLSNNLAFNR